MLVRPHPALRTSREVEQIDLVWISGIVRLLLLRDDSDDAPTPYRVFTMTASRKLLPDFAAFAHELADSAAEVICPLFRTALVPENKSTGAFDPVTMADRLAERRMRQKIIGRFPDHGIIGEEEGCRPPGSNWTWLLDPIDGTQSFLAGLPLWGTLIALNDKSMPVLGLMNQPFTKERFIGFQGKAWAGVQPLRTRACSNISSASLMCTTPERFGDARRRAAFDELASEARTVRYGGDCYAYCMLASGFVDVIVEAGLQPYDVQALVPIVEGAGGRMTAWDGQPSNDGETVLACGDPFLHKQLVARLRPAM